jgi:hypothetical protein
MDLRVDPKSEARRKRNNWLVLVALLAVAAFMYAMIVAKVSHYGLPPAP